MKINSLNIRTILLSGLALTLALSSCKTSDLKAPEETIPENKELSLTAEEARFLPVFAAKSNTISAEEARQRAEDVIGFLAEDNGMTRFAAGRQIKDIVAVSTPSTRTADANATKIPDTLAYICNFENDMGYTIISADNRVEEGILAYAAEGNVTNRTDNPGFALFLSYAEDYIVNQIDQFESRRDSMYNVILAKVEASLTDEDRADTTGGKTRIGAFLSLTTTATLRGTSEWTTSQVKRPMLPVEWGQGAPYNNYVRFYNSGGTTPTGCVATAAVQIMAYYKYPSEIDGYQFNWDRMIQYSGRNTGSYKTWTGVITEWRDGHFTAPADVLDQVARVMERVGSKVGMEYSPQSSGANATEVPRMLRKFGYVSAFSKAKYGYPSSGTESSYFYCDQKVHFTHNWVRRILDENRPLLVSGFTTKTEHKFLGINWYNSYDRGHAWVIDGYIERHRYLYFDVTLKFGSQVVNTYVATGDEYMTLFHNNWGWDGNDNGYFASGVFNTKTRAEESSATRNVDPHNYQYNVRIYPFIKR
jgi:hypothetical protein